MSSFLSRLKSTTSPSAANGEAPPKKQKPDPNAPQQSALEKHLIDYKGPIRADGSDKFFGFENPGSTCYANSIIQSLYYSPAFRDHVINFPSRSPQTTLDQTRNSLPRLNTNTGVNANSALSPTKSKATPYSPNPTSPKGKNGPAGQPGQPGPKPEDNKDSPDYKKGIAKQVGPCLYMDYENGTTYGMEGSLFTALKDIFEAVAAHRSRYGVVFPHKFMEILRRDFDIFRAPMHQDAHEFLNLVLNQVIDSVEAYSKNQALSPTKLSTNWVHELFEGTMTSETRCLTCENVSQRDEPFLDISVDLEHHSSVTACLRKYSAEEMLCERNKFHCDNCGGLQEAERRQKIKRLPKVLALHLKRFKYTEDMQRLFKLFHRVVFPWHLRLFNTTDDAEDPDRLYELYAVVVHIGGGPYHGHYVSIIKTSDRGWLLFDDELVEPVDKNYIQNFFGTGDDKTGLACAYVLFYQETTLEAVRKEQEAEGQKVEGEMAIPEEAVLVDALETNGFIKPGPNGYVHDPLLAATPTVEEPDKFQSLDHAATVPEDFNATPTHKPIEQTITSPGFFSIGRKKSDVQLSPKKNRAEKAREEKERKEAAKAQKVAEKEAHKERQKRYQEAIENRRKENQRYEEELRVALEASKETAKVEKQKAFEVPIPAIPRDKENGISRFRPASMSFRKSKLFGSKEKGSGDHSDLRDASTASSSQDHQSTSTENKESTPVHTPDMAEKIKNRFSLGRKKSQAGLL